MGGVSMRNSIEVADGLSRDLVLKRYMSLEKFSYLVLNKRMYFSRFDQFSDRLEGGVCRANFSNVSDCLEVLDFALNQPKRGAAQSEASGTFPSIFGERNRCDGDDFLSKIASWLYASCWTDIQHECDAMWKLYTRSKNVEETVSLERSVCIETTLGDVLDSLQPHKDYFLLADKVVYIDHLTKEFSGDELIFRPYFSKARHFSFENEVRFLVWPKKDDIVFSFKYGESTKNLVEHVDYDILDIVRHIGKIVVRGESGRECVLSVLREAGISVPVELSVVNQKKNDDIYSYMGNLSAM